MLSHRFPSYLLGGIFMMGAVAQYCDDPSFLLCTAPTDDSDNSGSDSNVPSGTANNQITDPLAFDWASLQNVASLPIGGKSRMLRRQIDYSVVCCNPDVDCLVLESIPFCYDEATTEFVLPDGSVGFVDNSTYYGSDGTFVDYAQGYYSSADGSTGTFAVASATDAAAAASETALVSVESVATNTASAPRGPLQTSQNVAVGSRSSGISARSTMATATNAGSSPTPLTAKSAGNSPTPPTTTGASSAATVAAISSAHSSVASGAAPKGAAGDVGSRLSCLGLVWSFGMLLLPGQM